MSRKLQVALVDDEPADNYLHQRVIEHSGQGEVAMVFEGAEAALLWLQEAPRGLDLILTDINMPGMNGFEFIEAYKQLPEALQARAIVVMLTSSILPEDRERATTLGVTCEPKPLTLENFHAMAQTLGQITD